MPLPREEPSVRLRFREFAQTIKHLALAPLLQFLHETLCSMLPEVLDCRKVILVSNRGVDTDARDKQPREEDADGSVLTGPVHLLRGRQVTDPSGLRGREGLSEAFRCRWI